MRQEPSTETLDRFERAWKLGQMWTVSSGSMRGVRVRARSAEEAFVLAVEQHQPEELGWIARVKADHHVTRCLLVELLKPRLVGYIEGARG